MKRFAVYGLAAWRRMVMKRVFVTIGCFVLLSALGSFMPSSPTGKAVADPPGAPVQIIAPLPLPTTGTHSVSGTVAATQSGPWNVGLNGNTKASPFFVRNADESNKTPWQVSLFTTSCNLPTSCILATQQVPAGKRLVIEYANAFLSQSSGPSSQPSFLLQSGGFVVYLGPVTNWFSGGLNWVTNAKLLAYVEELDVVKVFAVCAQPVQQLSVQLAGYLTDK